MKLAFRASDQALAMDEPHQEAFLSGLCQSHLMEFFLAVEGRCSSADDFHFFSVALVFIISIVGRTAQKRGNRVTLGSLAVKRNSQYSAVQPGHAKLEPAPRTLDSESHALPIWGPTA